jgi:hypothetical protein
MAKYPIYLNVSYRETFGLLLHCYLSTYNLKLLRTLESKFNKILGLRLAMQAPPISTPGGWNQVRSPKLSVSYSNGH